MNPLAPAAGLGVLSAASWGSSDFIGGIGARRAPALLVVFCGHSFAFLVLFAICTAANFPLPASRLLLYAAIAGFEGSLSLALFYRALALGAMGLTAALTGLITALVPLLFTLFHDGPPAPVTAIGLALGCVAIWLITHTPSASASAFRPEALFYGALAGIGFGAHLILFRLAGTQGALWPMTAARGAGVIAVSILLLVRRPSAPLRTFWLAGIAAGTLDTIGTLVYLQAALRGRLDVAAVICSFYPAGTILLAAVVLRERPSRRQLAGMGIALIAVMLLAL